MKKKEVIIGKTISIVVLIATIIIHNFVFKMPHVLVTSFIVFSVLLFVLCTIGDKIRKEKE